MRSAVGLANAQCSLGGKEWAIVTSLFQREGLWEEGDGSQMKHAGVTPCCCLSAGGTDSTPPWDGKECFPSAQLLEVSMGNGPGSPGTTCVWLVDHSSVQCMLIYSSVTFILE